MNKIPTLLVRNTDDRAHVLPQITPGCEWVFAGEGLATRKYDGTCVMRDEDGKWWARREVKPGRPAPENYVPVEHDDVTGKTMGWEPIEQSPFHKAFLDATETVDVGRGIIGWRPGTYELCGPKVQGNPERFERHELIEHARAEIVWFAHPDSPEAAMDLVRAVGELGFEGIVWHHRDGRMAKLKARDVAA